MVRLNKYGTSELYCLCFAGREVLKMIGVFLKMTKHKQKELDFSIRFQGHVTKLS